jgi:predicted permease
MELSVILYTAVNAVAPVILTILLGYFLKRIGFLTPEFLKIGNKLVFNVCLPAMLFVNVYVIEGFSAINWDIVLYCVAALVVLFVLGLGITLASTRVPERRGCIWQCTFRSNFAIIGLSLASALGGDDAVAVAAIVSSFTVPLFNVLSVIALSVFVEGNEGKTTPKALVMKMAKNPLILSVLLGLGCLAIREAQLAAFGRVIFALNRETKFLYTTLSNLKSIASLFALIVLGGQFEFSAVKGLLKEIVAGTTARIVIAPIIGIGGAVLLSAYTGLLSCGPAEYPALIAMFGSPVAVSSAVMAGNMGNDEQLATQLVVWTSIFSIVTVFLEVCILMAAGLIVA